MESDRRLAAAFFLHHKGYRNDQIASTINLYYEGQVQQDDVSGFINYCFSFPVSNTSGRWKLLLNYTYNVPVALPGEDFEYPANGYF